jgi:hypothetical protein
VREFKWDFFLKKQSVVGGGGEKILFDPLTPTLSQREREQNALT